MCPLARGTLIPFSLVLRVIKWGAERESAPDAKAYVAGEEDVRR